MIEEKTKEPQSQAPAAPVKGREKLRSFWAKVQISGLLRRHRFRRKTQRHMNDVAKKLRASALVLAVGEALYALGFAAEYMVVRTGRGIAAVARRLARWCRNALHTIIATAFPGAAQMFKDLLAPLYLFFKGLGAVAAHANDVRRERGFGASVKAAGRYFVGGLKRNLSLLPRTAMYILPLCMLAVFVTVWNRTMAQPYALAVQVNGQTVGYVANEEVFNLAKEDVMQRINYAGSDKTELTIEPTYTISVTHKTMDESETANAILQSASDQISEGTALYLDGELTAVCSDGDTLRGYLESLLAPYEDQADENVSVGFSKNVTLEDGVYFNDSFEDDNSIENFFFFDKAFSYIYTFGPTCRAENSNTTRHAAEFWMIEPEIAFADLEDDMELAEAMLKYVIRYVMEHAPEEMQFFNSFVDKGLIERLNHVVNSEFGRVTYTEAIELLEKNNDKFDYKVYWGCDLQTEHERYLTEQIFKRPVFVTDYPKEIKAFYMKLNDDNKTVAAMDCLVPGIGEIIGGSQREDDYEKLLGRMKELGLAEEDYGFYLDLRKYGSTHHAGFGLGFERCVMYLTGMGNIRDVIPFPRTVNNCEL